MSRAMMFGAVFVPALVLTGCFEDDDVTVAVDDGGSEAAPGSDAKAPGSDAKTPGSDGGSDSAPPPDGSHGEAEAAPPGSVPLASGKGLSLIGVTSDGNVIYAGVGTATNYPIYAIPISGGSVTEIATVSNDSLPTIAGPILEITTGVTSANPGTTQTWSAASGLHTITSATYVDLSGVILSDGYFQAISPDFKSIAYFDNYDMAAQTADAYVANIDGTGAKLLEASVPGVGGSSCWAALSYVGTSVVLAYCAPSDTTGSIYSFTGPSWSSVPLATNINLAYLNLNNDPTGTNLLINAPAGALEVVPVSGATPTTIDPTGSAMLSQFTSDGKDVIYLALSGVEVPWAGPLLRSPIASPSPVTLESGNFEGIQAISPDSSSVLVYENFTDTPQDLYAASTTTSGKLTKLTTSTPVEDAPVGSWFTNDSSHAIFLSSAVFTEPPGLDVSTLKTSPVGSSSVVTLATKSYTAFASGASKVVFDDNFAMVGSNYTLDIKAYDTASSSSPTTVVSQVNFGGGGSFFLSPDGTKIVYATDATSTGGVYVTSVP
jgi:hypothetical protein